MKTTYLLRHYWRFLTYGFLLTFFCNIGQTFFIGLYSAPIIEDMGLSNSDFGALYGTASLLSAASLIWIGRLIDHVDLRWYTVYVLLGAIGACFLMAWSPTVLVLGLSLYLLRLTGQGLMPHISSTSMARYFTIGRGKAISITSLGIHASQILLPSIAVGLTLALGWRESWIVYGFFFTVIVIPLVLWMMKGHGERHKRWEAEIALSETSGGGQSRFKKTVYKELFTDPRFYVLLPAIIALPVISTAFFFYQGKLVEYKGWDMEIFALSFAFMATAAAFSSLLSGFLADKFLSVRQLPFLLLPFCLGLLIFILGDHPVLIFVGMTFLGLSQGAMMTLNGTLWPELYGTANLGAIRSLMVSIMVFGTALSPAVLGFVYDAGITTSAVFSVFIAYMVLVSVLQLRLWNTQQQDIQQEG